MKLCFIGQVLIDIYKCESKRILLKTSSEQLTNDTKSALNITFNYNLM